MVYLLHCFAVESLYGSLVSGYLQRLSFGAILKKAFLTLLAPLIVIFGLVEAPMAFGKTLVLASQFNGTLVDEAGTPQPGVKVTRTWTWHWNDSTGSDQTETDADGRFTFAKLSESNFWAGLAPHEPMIDVKVIADGPNGETLLFAVTKRDYKVDAELAGRELKGPGINLVCRIDQEPDRSGPFRGTCRAAE